MSPFSTDCVSLDVNSPVAFDAHSAVVSCSEHLGHLHARRFTTSEDALSVTESPMAWAPYTISRPPAAPKIRRATLTQSDAKLYAMTQACRWRYTTKLLCTA